MADNGSNWAQYLKEREGKNVLEWAHSFVVWEIKDNKWVYAVDVWVAPELRQKGTASRMLDVLSHEAEQKGLNLLTSADLRDKNCATSIKAILHYGFSPLMAQGQFIYFEKLIAYSASKDI